MCNDNVDCFQKVQAEMLQTYEAKNHDYGDSVHKTFEEFGITSFLVRLSDKLNRAIALSKSEAMVKGESMRDTLLDMANYATIAVVELDRELNATDPPPPPKQHPMGLKSGCNAFNNSHE